MVNVRNVRGGTGLDPISAEVDEILDSIFANAKRTSEQFFDSFALNPQPIILAEWLATRAWREIDYVFLLNEEIRRYGLGFERKHITLLAKQAFQEAEHYEAVSHAVESLGGTAPTSVPPDSRVWSEFLWDCLDRHPLAAVAAWNASETSATGSRADLSRRGTLRFRRGRAGAPKDRDRREVPCGPGAPDTVALRGNRRRPQRDPARDARHA